MPILYLMSGLPGSGKTTYAKEKFPQAKRINRDELRQMFDNGRYSAKNEDFIVSAELELAKLALLWKFDVVIDDTNLKPETVDRWVRFARDNDVMLHHHHLVVDVEECIQRDALRESPVGRERILEMARKFGMLEEEA